MITLNFDTICLWLEFNINFLAVVPINVFFQRYFEFSNVTLTCVDISSMSIWYEKSVNDFVVNVEINEEILIVYFLVLFTVFIIRQFIVLL